jgi:alpha-glucosidase
LRALALLPLLACKGKAAPCALDLPPFSIDCEGDRLQITHAGTPLFQGEAGWLEAGEGSPTVEAARGSFTFDDTTLSRCAGLTGSALVEEGDGAVLTAELGDCGAQVELQIERVNEETLRLSLELDGAPEINRIQLTSDAPEDERVTGFGAQYNHLDLKGQAVPIWCQEQGIGRGLEPLSSALGAGVGNPAGDALTTYTCVPWALSTAGYGWLSHASAYTVFDLTEPEQTTLSTWQSSLTLDLFAGEDPASLVEALTAVTGRMAPLPEWSQRGPIVRIGGGSEAVRERLAAYVDAGVPVSAVWIEDWCGLRETSFGDRIWWNWVVDRARYRIALEQARANAAVCGLPSLHMVDGQQEIGVLATFLGEIQDVDRSHKALHRQSVGVAIGIVLAGDPMVRRVKVRARMLAQFQPIPRPKRSVLVI